MPGMFWVRFIFGGLFCILSSFSSASESLLPRVINDKKVEFRLDPKAKRIYVEFELSLPRSESTVPRLTMGMYSNFYKLLELQMSDEGCTGEYDAFLGERTSKSVFQHYELSYKTQWPEIIELEIVFGEKISRRYMVTVNYNGEEKLLKLASLPKKIYFDVKNGGLEIQKMEGVKL